MRSSRVVAALVMGLAAFVAAGETRQPIVDVHLHTHAAVRFGRSCLPNLITGKPSAATTDDAAIGRSIETIEGAPVVSTAVKRDIFYNNAVRFFRLKERELKPWR